MEGPGRIVIQLDTHVVVWLYEGKRERFSGRALELIESEDLAISPIVLLELQYLFEIDRILARPGLVSAYLQERLGLTVDSTPFAIVTEKAVELTWTRDPFDRLIAAQAACGGATLVTKDSIILKNYPGAAWE
jgi:PIN domain nuclease of toxin-antitoxin system